MVKIGICIALLFLTGCGETLKEKNDRADIYLIKEEDCLNKMIKSMNNDSLFRIYSDSIIYYKGVIHGTYGKVK